MLTLLIVWSFFLSLIFYLFGMLSLVRILKTDFVEYYDAIGRPSSFDPGGQVTLMKVLLVPGFVPEGFSNKHSVRFAQVRVSALACILLFFTVLMMIWLEKI